jgi:hypothetical protein
MGNLWAEQQRTTAASRTFALEFPFNNALYKKLIKQRKGRKWDKIRWKNYGSLSSIMMKKQR